MLEYLIAICVITLTCAILFFKWKLTYWKRKKVFTLPPTIPFGNARELALGKRCIGEDTYAFYKEYKARGLPYGGYYSFTVPIFIPVDIELIRNILTTDFQYFTDRVGFVNEENDPLSGHLLFQKGAKWKALRTKLTPAFSSGKLKLMFQTLVKCADGLSTLLDECEKMRKPFDIKDTFARFTTDVIASVAFGIECDCLKNPDAEFRKLGRRIFEADKMTAIKTTLIAFAPSLFVFLNLSVTRKDVEEFIINVVKQTAEYRDKNKVERKDFMQLLLNLRNTELTVESRKVDVPNGETKKDISYYQNGLSLNEVAAQMFFFFAAGYETSATTLNYLMYELVTHTEIQDKLRQEINDVLSKHNGELTYEAINEMTYAEMCILETLRKYPPVSTSIRICTKTYKVPNSDLVIPKDTSVMISIYGIHHDPDFYPDPEKFDPERFTEENKNRRPPATFQGFGEGPRICIGLRLGMLQTKVGLTAMLRNFKFSLNPKTKTPITFDPRQFILTADDSIWIDVQKI